MNPNNRPYNNSNNNQYNSTYMNVPPSRQPMNTPHGLPFDPIEEQKQLQTMYPNRYNFPTEVTNRGVSHQINTNQYYNNKESWNTCQFNRNTQAVNLYNDAHGKRYDTMNILFSDNYNTQRKEAYDHFYKRNRTMDASQLGTQSNARFGFVDFQDQNYRDYLQSRQIKRTTANSEPAPQEPSAGSSSFQRTYQNAEFQGYMPPQYHSR
jgi:hypothetical protein